jgi:hypothetical protein
MIKLFDWLRRPDLALVTGGVGLEVPGESPLNKLAAASLFEMIFCYTPPRLHVLLAWTTVMR